MQSITPSVSAHRLRSTTLGTRFAGLRGQAYQSTQQPIPPSLGLTAGLSQHVAGNPSPSATALHDELEQQLQQRVLQIEARYQEKIVLLKRSFEERLRQIADV